MMEKTDKIEEDLKETIRAQTDKLEGCQRELNQSQVKLAKHRASKACEEIQKLRKQEFDKEPLRLRLCTLHMKLTRANTKEQFDILDEIKLIQQSLEVM